MSSLSDLQDSSLVQWRALRNQQDIEYRESLRIDQKKVWLCTLTGLFSFLNSPYMYI